jgi:tetratricopeptide (TPR) repeat protein
VIGALVPLLLDRGDPPGRAWALLMATAGDTPALRTALRDFALGQRGTDRQRVEAAEFTEMAGVIRMWIAGQWRDVEVLAYEIDRTQRTNLPPQVRALHDQAHAALMKGDAATAGRLLRLALALAPDEPSLHNNLLMAIDLQGRHAESMAMMRAMHARFPDYWFSKLSRAQLLVKEGKLDEAEAVLKPMRSTTKLHISEFSGLMIAMIDLLLARGKIAGAQSQFDLWARLEPAHYALGIYKERILQSRGT